MHVYIYMYCIHIYIYIYLLYFIYYTFLLYKLIKLFIYSSQNDSVTTEKQLIQSSHVGSPIPWDCQALSPKFGRLSLDHLVACANAQRNALLWDPVGSYRFF